MYEAKGGFLHLKVCGVMFYIRLDGKNEAKMTQMREIIEAS